jgi:tetratricopeptide (TPR) repeat protein
MRAVWIVTISTLLGGCVSAINTRNAEVHAQAGYSAQGRGDWEMAARQFAQAVVNSDLADADPRGRATVNYEYGRAMGVVCRYDDSEKYLLRAKDFDEKSGRPPFLPLYELAVLNVYQRKYNQAIAYFQQLMPFIESEKLTTTAPLGVADAYEKWAIALEATGNQAGAEAMRAKAAKIRSENPNAKPLGPGTPYGTRCGKAS